MKRSLAVALLAAVLCMAGCAQPKESPESVPEPVRLANPVEVVAAGELHALGYYLALPAGATEITYSIVDDAIGQAQFGYGGRAFSMRAAEGSEADVSGVYEEFGQPLNLTVEFGGHALELEVKPTASGGVLASWSYEPVRYTLFTADSMGAGQMVNLAKQLMEAGYALMEAGESEKPQVVTAQTVADELGIGLGAPEGAEGVEYSILQGGVALVEFGYGGHKYAFSAAKEPEVPVQLSFKHAAEVDVQNGGFESVMTLLSDPGGGAAATWANGGANYCLLAKGEADTTELMHVAMLALNAAAR